MSATTEHDPCLRDAPGFPRLHVEVKDEAGNVVYKAWQGGPLDEWTSATLYFSRTQTDREGNVMGYSEWA